MEERLANKEEIGLIDGEIPVQNFNELAFNPSNVALAEGTGDRRPVDVFQSGVISVL